MAGTRASARGDIPGERTIGAPTQELAAEALDLPLSTYKRHLRRGVERVGAWLWQRELYGAAARRRS